MMVPVAGRISQNFGNKLIINGEDVYAKWGYLGHNGVDYAVPVSTSVYAPHAGVIKERRNDATGYGNYLKIESDKEGSVLGHLSEFLVNVNKNVEEGELLALSGNTGASTGPHLHWGYYTIPRDRENGYGGFIDQQPFLNHAGDINWEQILNEKVPEEVKVKYNLIAYAEFNNNEDTIGSIIEKFKEFVTQFNTCKDTRKSENELHTALIERLEDEINEWKGKAEKAGQFESNLQKCTTANVDLERKRADWQTRAEKAEKQVKEMAITIDADEIKKKELNIEIERRDIKVLNLIENLTWGEIFHAITFRIKPKEVN